MQRRLKSWEQRHVHDMQNPAEPFAGSMIGACCMQGGWLRSGGWCAPGWGRLAHVAKGKSAPRRDRTVDLKMTCDLVTVLRSNQLSYGCLLWLYALMLNTTFCISIDTTCISTPPPWSSCLVSCTFGSLCRLPVALSFFRLGAQRGRWCGNRPRERLTPGDPWGPPLVTSPRIESPLPDRWRCP